jgi:hypothetical protein
MKINEITNAEDALALWKLISDNTWSAIQQQAEQQAREKAERAANTKSTKAPKRGVGRKPAPIAPPKPKLPLAPAVPQVKTANIAPVQQPVISKGALPKKGPWGAVNTPMSTAAASLPTKPVAPSADALQKPGTQLKLMAREKGVVRV